MNQFWNIVNSNLRNKLQCNFEQNSYIIIQENAFPNVVCQMAVNLSWPRCVKILLLSVNDEKLNFLIFVRNFTLTHLFNKYGNHIQNCWLIWCHNEHDCVTNYQCLDCLLSRLFRHRSKKTSKVHVTGLCEGNQWVTGIFPAQRTSNVENVSIWWRHHVGGYHRSYSSSVPPLENDCHFTDAISDIFLWMKNFVFWLKFLWSLFLGSNWQ